MRARRRRVKAVSAGGADQAETSERQDDDQAASPDFDASGDSDHGGPRLISLFEERRAPSSTVHALRDEALRRCRGRG